MAREYQNDSRPLNIESYPISDISEFWINDNLRVGRAKACRHKVAGPLTHLSERDL